MWRPALLCVGFLVLLAPAARAQQAELPVEVVREYKGLKGHVGGVAFSPDGSRIAAASMYSTAVHVWDAHTAKPLIRLEAGRKVYTTILAFTNGGKELA